MPGGVGAGGGGLNMGISVSPASNGNCGPMDSSNFTRLFNHSAATNYNGHHAYATDGVFGGQ